MLLPLKPKFMYLIMRKFFFVFFVICSLTSSAQSITNAGTDFWLAFTQMMDSTDARYWVNISGSQNANGTVEIAGTGFSQSFSITPGSITRVNIPSNLAFIKGSDVIVPRAIRINSTNNIVVYAVTYRQFRHEASLVLPKSALGTRYRAMSYYSTTRGGRLWKSEFNVVSGEDTVDVEITPTANIGGGRAAGIPYVVRIPPRSVYQAQADSVQDDLTGTLIRSLDPNKKIAVFSGNEWTDVVCPGTLDPLYEEMFPVSTWGREYLVVPTATVNKDYYRVMADEDSTVLLRDGVQVAILAAGQFFEDTLLTSAKYSSNKPISLAQFLITGSGGCSPNPRTDPSMIMLNSNEQMFLDSITFFAVDTNQLDTHFVNVLTRTNDTAVVFLDGLRLSGFQTFPSDTEYSYVSVSVSPGSHTLVTSGCGFLAYSMGYGNAVSYAYAAGVLLVDLNNQVTFSNLSRGSDTVCVNDTLQFSLATLGTPLSFHWDFDDGTTDTVANPRKKYALNGSYIYTVIIEYQCFIDTLFDTIEITNSPIVDLGSDTVLCSSNALDLDAANPGMVHVWSTGDTSRRITVLQSGTYSVSVTNRICFDSDTIEVEIPLKGASYQWFPTDPDKLNVCSGDTILLFSSYVVPALSSEYDMDDGNRIPDRNGQIQYSFEKGGSYVVDLLADFMCNSKRVTFVYSDTIEVTQMPRVDLGKDTSFCLTDSYELMAGAGAERYLWEPGGETSPSIEVTQTGTYSVLAGSGSCIAKDEVFVEIPSELAIPNVFTPDGDGTNDLFRVEGINLCQDYDMYIFNRWGNLIYHTNLVHGAGWDGRTFSGEEASEGVYFFVLSRNGESYRGSLSLLR